jgi:hypothetical protein
MLLAQTSRAGKDSELSYCKKDFKLVAYTQRLSDLVLLLDMTVGDETGYCMSPIQASLNPMGPSVSP